MTTPPDLELQRLVDLGIALSSETNLTRLLDKIVAELRQLTNADGGSLYLKEGDRLRFAVCQNETLALSRDDYLSVASYEINVDHHSIAGYVALTGRPLSLTDVYQIPGDRPYRFDPSFDQQYHYRTRSMWTLPLKDHMAEVVGVLQLVNARDSRGEVIHFALKDQELVLSLASLAAVAINNARLIQTIENLFEALMVYSVSAIDARSPHTAGHSRRVAGLCLALARAVNDCGTGPLADSHLSEAEVEELRYSAWLHDIGKIGVRDSLLDKELKLSPEVMAVIRWRFYLAQLQAPSPADREALESDYQFLEELNRSHRLPEGALARLEAIVAREVSLPGGESQPLLSPWEHSVLAIRHGNLTSQEYREIQGHVVHTRTILQKIPFTKQLARVPEFAALHHERLDGSGYPLHLQAPALPLQARILAIADIFDALTARDRPYRRGGDVQTALQFLRQEAAAGRLDPDLVELFINREVYQEVLQTLHDPAMNGHSYYRSDSP